MEKLIECYHQLLTALEACQKSGKFTLGEATAVFSNIINLKTAIESLSSNSSSIGSSTTHSQELEDTKVELMTKNISLDHLQRNLEEVTEAQQDLQELLTALKAKYKVSDEDLKKLKSSVESSVSMDSVD